MQSSHRRLNALLSDVLIYRALPHLSETCGQVSLLIFADLLFLLPLKLGLSLRKKAFAAHPPAISCRINEMFGKCAEGELQAARVVPEHRSSCSLEASDSLSHLHLLLHFD